MKPTLMTIAAAIVLVSVSSCGTSPEPAPSSPAAPAASAPLSRAEVEQAVRQIETERLAALPRKETAFVERVYADDYAVAGANGVVRTRAEVISDMQSGVQTIETLNNEDIQVRVYGDTAVVTGRQTTKGTYKGRPSASPTVFTRVYVRQDDQWRLVANHSSGVPQQ